MTDTQTHPLLDPEFRAETDRLTGTNRLDKSNRGFLYNLLPRGGAKNTDCLDGQINTSD